jgi:hypothetical protein
MTELVDDPHLDEDGEYHGARIVVDVVCPHCHSPETWEQYNTVIGELVSGCDDCGWESF